MHILAFVIINPVSQLKTFWSKVSIVTKNQPVDQESAALKQLVNMSRNNLMTANNGDVLNCNTPFVCCYVVQGHKYFSHTVPLLYMEGRKSEQKEISPK